jgi:hypothetical protein
MQSRRVHPALLAIKLAHTAIWLFFVACIVAIPIAGAYSRFRTALLLIGVVLIECILLALNRLRCPLTNLAARYTDDRSDNFDIYLPLWLARHNQMIFGSLFLLGSACVTLRWLASPR